MKRTEIVKMGRNGTSKDRLRVLIADDQPQVRSALRLFLEQKLGVNAVDEASNLEQALQLIGVGYPDLVLLDWELPGQSGAATLAGLRRVSPGSTVIALSGRPEAKQAALAAGADGFVSKGEPPEWLMDSVSKHRPE
jgi:DNA-binding NarL/FixJ family response regulator